MYKEGTDFAKYFGDQTTVITSTTVRDEYLSDLTMDQEERVVRGTKPEFHIPGDVPVYERNDRQVRKERISECMRRTVDMAQRLESTDTKILPLIKGVNPEEWSLVSSVFRQLGVNYGVFYGVQYFTDKGGFVRLKDHLDQITSEMPFVEIMTIGPMAPKQVRELPDSVTATSGLHQWLKRTNLRDVSYLESWQRYERLKEEVRSALESRQAELTDWTESQGAA